jgi:AcrR family transcriptional regulator
MRGIEAGWRRPRACHVHPLVPQRHRLPLSYDYHQGQRDQVLHRAVIEGRDESTRHRRCGPSRTDPRHYVRFVTASRPYVSPRRQAQAVATREAILQAFADQLSERGRDTLSPLDAARQVGVSVRTVHLYFPNLESQMQALGGWYDRQLSLDAVATAQGPADLPRYFRDIHSVALTSPHRAVAAALLQWPDIRQPRRAPRLDAIHRSVAAIGAPTMAAETPPRYCSASLGSTPHGRCTTSTA